MAECGRGLVPGRRRRARAALVEHPAARFLVDPALCADVHRRVLPELPTLLRSVVAPDRSVTGLPEALAAAGVAPGGIDFALPTHLHWDHVSGLHELPDGLPVRVQDVERSFALAADGPRRAPLGVARGPLLGRHYQTYELDGPPVLTFARSHDVFADGSVLVVDLPGHTPGSVGVLLRLAGDRRVLLAGDAAWHGLQITRLREKAPFPGDLVDAALGVAVLARGRGRVEVDAVLGDADEPGVVPADRQGDQGGVRAQRVELRRRGARRHAEHAEGLGLGHVLGLGAAAGHVAQLGDAQ